MLAGVDALFGRGGERLATYLVAEIPPWLGDVKELCEEDARYCQHSPPEISQEGDPTRDCLLYIVATACKSRKTIEHPVQGRFCRISLYGM